MQKLKKLSNQNYANQLNISYFTQANRKKFIFQQKWFNTVAGKLPKLILEVFKLETIHYTQTKSCGLNT
jgi:hypothetical protein